MTTPKPSPLETAYLMERLALSAHLARNDHETLAALERAQARTAHLNTLHN